jgi:hypothetical protein
MKGLAKLRAMLTANMGAQADTTELSKRARQSRNEMELLDNPRALEYFKEQGATDEKIQRMREMVGKQAKAQADSLSSMRQQMRAASTERARKMYGDAPIDRAIQAGWNVSAEDTTDTQSPYTWERLASDKENISLSNPMRANLRSNVPPDEDTIRQIGWQGMVGSRKMSLKDYSDSLRAVQARRAARNK